MDVKYIVAIIVVIIAIITLVVVGMVIIGYGSTMKARHIKYKEVPTKESSISSELITTSEQDELIELTDIAGIDDIMNNDDMTTLTSEDKDLDYPPDDVEKTSSGWTIMTHNIPCENSTVPQKMISGLIMIRPFLRKLVHTYEKAIGDYSDRSICDELVKTGLTPVYQMIQVYLLKTPELEHYTNETDKQSLYDKINHVLQDFKSAQHFIVRLAWLCGYDFNRKNQPIQYTKAINTSQQIKIRLKSIHMRGTKLEETSLGLVESKSVREFLSQVDDYVSMALCRIIVYFIAHVSYLGGRVHI